MTVITAHSTEISARHPLAPLICRGGRHDRPPHHRLRRSGASLSTARWPSRPRHRPGLGRQLDSPRGALPALRAPGNADLDGDRIPGHRDRGQQRANARRLAAAHEGRVGD